MTTAINLQGDFYPSFIAKHNSGTDKGKFYSPETQAAIHTTIKHIIKSGDDKRPGMLLGKIQSGKTKMFTGVIALALDNGFEVVVVLTKNSVALVEQTVVRLREDFNDFVDEDKMYVDDIGNLSELPIGVLKRRLVITVKKQADNLRDVIELLNGAHADRFEGRRILLIDDEADAASVGYARPKGEEVVVLKKIHELIDELRKKNKTLSFLQVTATPYALYLQPEDISVSGTKFVFQPVRPSFTVLVPVDEPPYIGGDFYFRKSRFPDTVASYLYEPVGEDELGILKKEDKRTLKQGGYLTNKSIRTLRSALMNFLVGGIILFRNNPSTRPTFLVHTETTQNAHVWQQTILKRIIKQLKAAANDGVPIYKNLVEAAYEELQPSIALTAGMTLHSVDELAEALTEKLNDGEVHIQIVNSEREIKKLLDQKGALKRLTRFTIFIGAQSLDRGVTIPGLIGFFYGRRPQTLQQDTVLQHHRMYGYRNPEELAVTRFYCPDDIYDALQRIHEMDAGLRKSVSNSTDQGVVFIQKDDAGKSKKIRPASPNKIKISSISTLGSYTRLLRYGFTTRFKYEVDPINKAIDAKLARLADGKDMPKGFMLSVEDAIDIKQMIDRTLDYTEALPAGNKSWPEKEFNSVVSYLSENSTSVDKGKVWCIVRTDRNSARKRKESYNRFNDRPDGGDYDDAKALAESIPCLLLLRQNGSKEQGWDGVPFYWPVLVCPKRTPTIIWANETIDSNITTADDEDESELSEYELTMRKKLVGVSALSIRQPYAEEIMQGVKTIEYRSTITKKFERVAIYASSTSEEGGEDLPKGVLVGTVQITGCKKSRNGEYEWQLANPERFEQPIKPKRRAQPKFFYPFG